MYAGCHARTGTRVLARAYLHAPTGTQNTCEKLVSHMSLKRSISWLDQDLTQDTNVAQDTMTDAQCDTKDAIQVTADSTDELEVIQDSADELEVIQDSADDECSDFEVFYLSLELGINLNIKHISNISLSNSV